MKKLLLLVVLMMPMTATANSIDMRGAGNLSCPEWIGQRGSTDYFSAANWVLGFLSGSAWDSGRNILAGSQPENLFIAIDKYCAEHPDDSLSEATVALAYHLLEQMQGLSELNTIKGLSQQPASRDDALDEDK